MCDCSNADTASAVLPRLACITANPYQAEALELSISVAFRYDSSAPRMSPVRALEEASSSISSIVGSTMPSPWRM